MGETQASARVRVQVIKKPRTTTLWPAVRSGHRVSAIGHHLIIFGGFNTTSRETNVLYPEIWMYNSITERWVMMNVSEVDIQNYVASSAVATIGKYLLVFGGTAFPFGEFSCNLLRIVDLKSNRMYVQQTTGERPLPTYGQGCAVDEVNKKLYIVGGTTGLVFYSEVYCLDLVTKQWERLKSKNPSMPVRYRHEVAFYDNKLYVFGGGTHQVVHDLKNIPYFDLKTHSWESAHTLGVKRKNSNSFDYPRARKCHSGVFVPATELSDAKFIISGGMGMTLQFDDIWAINLRTLQWALFDKRLPQKTHFHDAALLENGEMVIFGGVINVQSRTERRINELATCCVAMPSLQSIVWKMLLAKYPALKTQSKAQLREIGVPECITKWFD